MVGLGAEISGSKDSSLAQIDAFIQLDKDAFSLVSSDAVIVGAIKWWFVFIRV